MRVSSVIAKSCIAALVGMAPLIADADSLCPKNEAALPPNVCPELPENPTAIPGSSIPRTWVPGRFLLGVRNPEPTTAGHAADQDPNYALAMRELREISPESILRPVSIPGVFELEIRSVDNPEQALALMNRLARVQDPRSERPRTLFSTVEPVFLIPGASDPNDEYFTAGPQGGPQWGLSKIGAPAAWDLLPAAHAPVLIAIVDSGVWYEVSEALPYNDMQDRLWSDPTLVGPDGIVGHGFGANFTVSPVTGDVRDDQGHGTGVAGIAGAATNNGQGSPGKSYGIAGTVGSADGFLLMPLKAMVPDPANSMRVQGTSTDIADAIHYAVQHGAGVINLSLGYPTQSAAMCNEIRNAGTHGVVVVASAGNEGGDADNFPDYPAGYQLDNIISVMASTNNDSILPSNSNHGCVNVDIAAPGQDIWTTTRPPPIPPFSKQSGTSEAAPFVSGAAALVKSMNPSWSPSQIRAHLMDSSKKVRLRNASNGRLDIRNALTSPANIKGGTLPSTWSAGGSLVVKWDNRYSSRACPTVYVRLLPAGTVPANDTCSNQATCRELASAILIGDKKKTVTLPTALATNTARLRVGCDGSGLFDEVGPFTIN